MLEHRDGAGGHRISDVVASGDEHHDGAVLVDMDDAGALDIMSIGRTHGRVVLYENLAPPASAS